VIGETISHYTILERLGGGGMGVVYKAEDTRLKRFVALKFLPPELTRDAAAKERFEQEARTASALDHPNVCTIHEIDETADGQVFICMAFYDGESLKSRLARGPLSIEETLNIVVQVADGMKQAHDHGIVHRDIKPANVMLTRDGAPKIVDFGIATLVGRPHAGDAGEIAGTVSYMSPEQARGEALGQRTDIWSLGVTMYEMLTGRLPFIAEGEQPLLQAIVHQEPPPLESLRTGVPAPLAAIAAKCLRKRPDERYQRAAELIADLRSVRRALTSATVSTLPGAAPLSSVRRRLRPAITLPVGAAMVALVLLAVVPAARNAVRGLLNIQAVPDQQHMAVLPFTNVGDDPANRSFCDGLTEILTSTLTQFERFQGELWVVPATEIRTREVKSASDARKVFNVNLVFTGGVQREGDRLRLALNLVDTENLRQLRSKVIEGTGADLTSLEDRVVAAMAEMLDVQLKPDEKKELIAGGTTVPAAYDLYVQARGALENYQGENDPERAAELFKQAIALDSRFALAYAGVAQADLESYRRKKDARQVDEAVTSARRALELDDRLGEAHVTLGSLGVTTGRYEDAVREFKRAIEIQARNAGAFTGLARTYDALGKAAEAEATYTEAIALRPEYWMGYTELGGFYYRRGRYEDAEKQFLKAVTLTPQNAWAYNNLGTVYLVRGRDAQAREMFEHSVAIRPLYGALSNLGTLYFREGKLARAATMYEKALVIRGSDFRVWGNLGTAYHFSDQNAKAKEAFAQAVKVAEQQRKVNPRDTRLLIDLAGYYGMLGEREKGLGVLELVLKAPPTDADSMAAIGQSFEDLGERERAIEWIRKALRAGFSVASLEEGPALRDLRSDARFKKLIEESSKKR